MIPNCVAIDTETTGLNTWRGDYPFAVGAAFPSGRRLFWRAPFDSGLKELLEDESIDKVFHNAKFDLRMLESIGYTIKGKIWDTMIFGHLLDGRDARGFLNLNSQSQKYLPEQYRKVTEDVDKWFIDNGHFKENKKKGTIKVAIPKDGFLSLPLDIIKRRVVGDADLTLRLFNKFYDTVCKTFPLLLKQEHDLLLHVKRMEDRGIMVNIPGSIQQQHEFSEIVDEASAFCAGIIGEEYFNINSSIHQRALLEKADLLQFMTEMTPGGKDGLNPQPKLSAGNLTNLHHPISHMLLMGKSAGKMLEFLAAIQEHHINGVIHPSYNQLGTNTGRFSCSRPNLQNLPIEGGHRLTGTAEELEETLELTGHIHQPKIRSLYEVRPGFVHIHSDKAKAELAMLAHYSNDETLIEIIKSGKDVHGEIGKLTFGDPPSPKEAKAIRRRTKDMVFGVLYGAGDKKLATKTGGNVPQAKAMKKQMMTIIPGLPKWMKSLEADLRNKGFIETAHGRRHYMSVREAYKSVNYMCQGTVGDEIKSRMVAVGDHFNPLDDCTMILNIHDEIVVEVPTHMAKQASIEMNEIMQETGIEYKVPMAATVSITQTNWGSADDIIFENGQPIVYKGDDGYKMEDWLYATG